MYFFNFNRRKNGVAQSTHHQHFQPMSSTTRYIIFGAIILLIFGLLAFNRSQEKRFDWRETYLEKSKEPFGSFILHEILRGYFPEKKLVDLKEKLTKSLPNPDSLRNRGEKANYFFIGDGFFADTADVDKLLLFVQEGNRAFVAANELPNYFLENIFRDSCLDDNYHRSRFRYEWLDSTALNFKHPQLSENQPFLYDFKIRGERQQHDWSYIDTFRTECIRGAKNLIPLGYFNEDYTNFARVNYGKGEIYLHSNPIVFTNYHLLDSTKLRYVEKCLTHLREGVVYWDTRNRLDRNVVRRMNGSNDRFDREGPLKYILSQPALRWAWFVFLGLIALYLIFATKRRQRPIPILDDKANTSLQFIQTIGQMYFQKNDSVRLSDMMFKQFQTFIREKYHLTTREMNDEFIKTLAQKSDVPEGRVKQIVDYQYYIERGSITEDSMVTLHSLLHNFYKMCK